jgi:hypothetical protein
MAVLHSDTHCFAFEFDDEFRFAESRLAAVGVPVMELTAEHGLTAEETIVAAERMAGLTPSNGAPQ